MNMKLPFHLLLTPVIKPYYGRTSLFCRHPTFVFSIFYTYLYGIIGFFINVNHLRMHMGERPEGTVSENELMLRHDLKIIITSMGIVQYACLLFGCHTENPALFLPHLTGQIFIVTVKLINVLLLLSRINMKSVKKLSHRIPSIFFMIFNWCQEFCVFRKYLCICDL